MAPQVSGMKMRNLILGVILGLLAVVHSTPVNTVIPIPAKAEDEVIREALSDGFLIEYTPLPITESPKRNTAVQAAQQLSSDSKESDMIEGSITGATLVSDESMTSVFPQQGGEHYASTTLSASHAQSSASTVLPRDTDGSSSDSSTTQSPQSSFTSSPMPYEGQPNVTPDQTSVSQTTTRLETSDESTTSVFLLHGGEHYASTTLSASHSQSSASTVLPRDTDGSSSDSSTTQSPQSSFTSSPMPYEGQPNVTPDQTSVSQTTTRLETSDESTTSVFLLHGGEHYASTTLSASHSQSSASTVLPRDTDGSSSDSSTTQSPQSSFTSSPMPYEGQPNVTPDQTSVSQTTTRLETSDESTTSVFLLHGGEHYASTTLSASHSQSYASTVLPRDTDGSSSDSSTTQSPQSSFTSSPVPNEGQPNITPDHISVSQTYASDLGSGHGEMLGLATSSSMTSSSNTQTTTASSTSTAALISGTEGSGLGSELESGMQDTTDGLLNKSETPASRQNEERSSMTSSSNTQTTTASSTSTAALIREKKGRVLDTVQSSFIQPVSHVHIQTETANPAQHQKGHSTPGWIIILGFIVGVAALVMLCVAIATRDRWNGPNQASKLETKTNSSNQQRELEMETFLHKDNPRENGKAAEYTVIPLDELPENYSSH